MRELWEEAIEGLRGRISAENFETWLGPVELDGIKDGELTLRIPNRFYADWLSAHYLELIYESLSRVSASKGGPQGPWSVCWEVDEALQARLELRAREDRAREDRAREDRSREDQAREDRGAPAPHRGEIRGGASFEAGWPSPDLSASGLNPRYCFDNFVVGPSNQLAHAASVAAASSPGARYNPLFIYGGVGLGKTHLVNAIGHRVLSDRPQARVLFLSAERFTNEFIWALQNHRIAEFRQRYRSQVDLLCIDDIQFLAGREQTQEEFFHTFNALYHADRQIVVTSDVYPQQIKEMEERLISRFQWGLVADIQAPELDTRIAILKKKAEQEAISLPSDVALLIAQTVNRNVRELEGTLLRIAVKAEMLGRPIDLSLATDALGVAQASRPTRQVSVEEIQRAACEHFNIRLSDLKSRRRHRAVSFPRMVAMYVCRQRLNMSYPMLGDRFGGKDHTTVMNAVKKIGVLLESDPEVRVAVESIERKVGY